MPVGRLLVLLSGPAILGMMVNSLYNLVDTIFIGQGPGTLALAALAVCFPIQMFILAVAQTVGIGSASIISRALGAGDRARAERVAGGSFATAALLAAIIATLGLVFLDPVLRLFGATDAVIPYARDYLTVILPGGLLFAVAVSSNNLVRSEGNARTAMVSMMVGAGTNIILDPIMIFGLGLGIRGAAIATITGQAASFVYVISHFGRGRSHVRIRARFLRPRPLIALQSMKIGSASFARVVGGSLMSIALNNSVTAYGSDMHLGLVGVLQRFMTFLLMPLFGLIQGLQPIVGYNYGAKNYCRLRGALKLGVTAATTWMLFCYILIMLFPGEILSIFSSDARLLREGVGIMRILNVVIPVIGFQIVAASVFQALGRAGPALVLALARRVFFLVPLILLLPLIWGLRGIWIAYPVADVLATILTGALFYHEVRLMRDHCGLGEKE
jgi:putative MATE family efflux protein